MTQITGSVTATHLTYLTITNGDFETGDLTGWGTGGAAWSETNLVEIIDIEEYGVYSAQFFNVSTENPIYITQSLDLTSVSSILFYRKWHADGDNVGVFTVSIGDTNVATYNETETGAHTWAQKTIDVSDYTGSSTLKFSLQASDESEPEICLIYLDDVTFSPENIVTSATIEDNTKTWTADQFNTDGMFFLRSGDVRGFSCKILDTFENYIQVPTTFANVINNITSSSGKLPENGDFETGTITPWLIYKSGSGTVSISPDFAYNSDYGIQLYGIREPGYSYIASFYQEGLDLSNSSILNFAYKVNYTLNMGARTYEVNFQTDELGSETATTISLSATTGWIVDSVTIPEAYRISDVDLYFDTGYVEATTATLGAQVFIDNIYYKNITVGDTYLITYTPTSWEFATVAYEPFVPICNVNATTLTATSYGSGGFTLEFATEFGTYTGLTWTIDEDVFRADVNTDYSRIASIVKGRGTKICNGDAFSYLSDNTYPLTVSTIGDTFLRSAATAGADTIYVWDNTNFGTAWGETNFVLVVGHGDTQEVLEISATGANGECTIDGVTANAHSQYAEVRNRGCFYATGTETEVDNFLAALESIRGVSSMNCFIGSEYIELNVDSGTTYTELTDTTLRLFMETNYRDDSYGYSYPHAPGAMVIPNLYLGYPAPNPNSLYALYGSREAYVNPVGIVDNDALDKLCYNSLMSGTPNATWGRCIMPATLLPATVGIYDWVNIAEADSSATTCYQIVGLEFDGRKGIFTIELGSTEDYYIGSIKDQRGTFDLSLSNS